MTAYARPADLETALALLSDGARRVLAGGTDLYPGAGAQLDGPVLDITALPALKGITLNQGLRIGAATTWAEIAAADLPPALQGLQQAARQIGARQVGGRGAVCSRGWGWAPRGQPARPPRRSRPSRPACASWSWTTTRAA